MAVRYAQAPAASSGPTHCPGFSAHTAPRNHLAGNTPAGGTAPVPRDRRQRSLAPKARYWIPPQFIGPTLFNPQSPATDACAPGEWR